MAWVPWRSGGSGSSSPASTPGPGVQKPGERLFCAGRLRAARKMAQEAPGQTLQATALVHEAYLRLVDGDKVPHWNSRGHFFAAAAEAMRRILVDAARS